MPNDIRIIFDIIKCKGDSINYMEYRIVKEYRLGMHEINMPFEAGFIAISAQTPCWVGNIDVLNDFF